MVLNIELYKKGDLHCAYIADNCGGSGIEVSELDYESFAKEVGAYIADYSFSEDTDEELEDEDQSNRFIGFNLCAVRKGCTFFNPLGLQIVNRYCIIKVQTNKYYKL